ncbi:MAG: GGDEF domain-containing protein [Calditrichaeota bacterium]|nr:MAG: GGDEF domain-containing protein [Calditrichota bacterium]
MSIEILLIAFLVFCVIILTFLLVRRVTKENRQNEVIKSLYKDTLSTFFNKNSAEGSLVEVARQFSDILKESFDCKQIIFLRKKRGALELNFYHNIRKFNRSDFNLNVNKQFLKILMEDFFPRDVSLISQYLSPVFKEKIDMFKMDQFFPVYWRENLYGLYIIKGNRYTNTETFRILIAQLAQSLSAAYHIKWHESKLEIVSEKSKQSTDIQVRSVESKYPVNKMLRLMRHRKIDAIVPRLLEALSDSAKLSNLTIIYQSNGEGRNIHLIQKNHTDTISEPHKRDFDLIVEELKQKRYTTISELESKYKESSTFISELKDNGFSYITTIPMPDNQFGLLTWKNEKKPELVMGDFALVQECAVELLENAYEYEKVEELSYKDNLTSLYNHRYFTNRLEEEIARAERYNRQLALMIFDVDELKSVNDSYGHQAGDEIIKQMGAVLQKSIRTIDVVSRYGGDEFCIIMPEADREMCRKFMERLHQKINSLTFEIGNTKFKKSCTISMGAAIYPEHAKTPKNLIYAADMALLEAKESGRNTSMLSSKTYLS